VVRTRALALGLSSSLPRLTSHALARRSSRAARRIAALRACPGLRELTLRGCNRVLRGFGAAADGARLPPHAALLELDLSHTNASDDELSALLTRTPSLRSLQLNFCAGLSDASLAMLPPDITRLDALGCERFSWHRLNELRERLEHAAARITDGTRGGGTRGGGALLRCDDSLVLGVGGDGTALGDGGLAVSLFAMLREYRAEEARIA
jgi:hypothetical protein